MYIPIYHWITDFYYNFSESFVVSLIDPKNFDNFMIEYTIQETEKEDVLYATNSLEMDLEEVLL